MIRKILTAFRFYSRLSYGNNVFNFTSENGPNEDETSEFKKMLKASAQKDKEKNRKIQMWSRQQKKYQRLIEMCSKEGERNQKEQDRNQKETLKKSKRQKKKEQRKLKEEQKRQKKKEQRKLKEEQKREKKEQKNQKSKQKRQRIQEERNKKKEERQKKQEGQKKYNDTQNAAFRMSFANLIISGTSLILAYTTAQNFLRKVEADNLLKTLGEQPLKIQPYFCEGSKVQQRIRKIIQDIDMSDISGQKDRIYSVALILGGQGIGKTQSTKHIINKMRQDKEKNQAVYYIPLSPKQNQKKQSQRSLLVTYFQAVKSILYIPPNKIQPQFQDLKNLLISVSNKQKELTNKKKSTYVFVDDINQMQKLDQKEKTHIIGLIFMLQKQGVKIMLASSSTSFFYDVWLRSDLSKLINQDIEIIWKQHDPAHNLQVLGSMGQYFGIQRKQIMEQVTRKGLSLRQSKQLLGLISKYTKNDEKKAREIIQDYDRNLQLDTFIRLNSLKEDAFNLKMDILNQIVLSDAPQTIVAGKKNLETILNKLQITHEVADHYGKAFQIIRNFDNWNLIIFGHPRTQALKRYIQKYIQKVAFLQKNKKSKN